MQLALVNLPIYQRSSSGNMKQLYEVKIVGKALGILYLVLDNYENQTRVYIDQQVVRQTLIKKSKTK